MVGRALWQNLKALVDCDKRILELQKNSEDASVTQKSNQQLMVRLQASLEEKKQRCFAKKRNVALQELTAQELKQQVETKKIQFAQLAQHKEYKAFEKEIATLSRHREEQEDILIKAWNDLESATKQLEEETIHVQEKLVTLTQENKEKEELVVTLQKQLSESLTQRMLITPLIPADWLSRYERMKHTIQDPLVPVVQNSCSACYYLILHQDLHKLKKAGILPCRNCYRFLYYEDEEKPKATTA